MLIDKNDEIKYFRRSTSSFKLLKSESNTVSRKIIEAMYINQLKPEINDKEECISINRFLVKN